MSVSQEYQPTYLFDSTKQINSRKTNQDQKCMHIDDGIYLHGWQRTFSEKYHRPSKILTETTLKALFTSQKPRIYVPIENQLKKL